MCVSLFVDLELSPEQEKNRAVLSRTINVICEETVVADVWGGGNEIVLHLAIDPGEQVVQDLYILTLAQASDARSLNDTWLTAEHPVSTLFRSFPGRIIRELEHSEVKIESNEVCDRPDHMFVVPVGTIAKDVRPPKIERPHAREVSPFSVMKVEFEEPLKKGALNLLRFGYREIGRQGRVSAGGKKAKNVQTTWLMYGPRRVRDKCLASLNHLRSTQVEFDNAYTYLLDRANHGAISIRGYSMQFAVDSRYQAQPSGENLYDFIQFDAETYSSLVQFVPEKERRRFTGFNVMYFISRPEPGDYPGLFNIVTTCGS